MRTCILTRFGPAAALAAFLFLSACMGTRPVTPTRYYLINPADYEAPLSSDGGSQPVPVVEITALRLPRYLEKPQIVVRKSRNQMEMAEYHQWGGNLRKNLMRTLSANLAFLLDTPHVTMAPFHAPMAPDARVAVEILGFEADETGQVRLSVQWRLSGGREGTPPLARLSTFEGPAPAASGMMDRIVGDMENLWGRFARELAEEILNRSSGTAGP